MMAAAQSAARTVTVACKLPTGLLCSVIDMEDYKRQTKDVAAGGPPRPVRVVTKARFRLRGYADARRSDSQGVIETDARSVVGLFGITRNVPADVWEEWWEQNQDYAPVKNGLIFAHAQDASVEAYAREHEKLKTGFDALDPRKPAPGVAPDNFDGMTQQDKKDAERRLEMGMPAYTG